MDGAEGEDESAGAGGQAVTARPSRCAQAPPGGYQHSGPCLDEGGHAMGCGIVNGVGSLLTVRWNQGFDKSQDAK